jgi:hypothetical protein
MSLSGALEQVELEALVTRLDDVEPWSNERKKEAACAASLVFRTLGMEVITKAKSWCPPGCR